MHQEPDQQAVGHDPAHLLVDEGHRSSRRLGPVELSSMHVPKRAVERQAAAADQGKSERLRHARLRGTGAPANVCITRLAGSQGRAAFRHEIWQAACPDKPAASCSAGRKERIGVACADARPRQKSRSCRVVGADDRCHRASAAATQVGATAGLMRRGCAPRPDRRSVRRTDSPTLQRRHGKKAVRLRGDPKRQQRPLGSEPSSAQSPSRSASSPQFQKSRK